MGFDYESAVAEATEAAAAYYQGDAPLKSDAAYDELLEVIAEYERNNPSDVIPHHLFDQVAAGTSPAADVEVHHSTPMLSLDKVKSLDDIDAFEARVAELGGTVSLEPKLDGMAVNAQYVDGDLTLVATRGDGATGEDITARVLAADIAGLPRRSSLPGTVNIRGELLMTFEDFAFSNRNRVAAGKEAFANPRNATAGTIRNADLGYDVRMTFVAYGTDTDTAADALASHGFIPSASLWRGHPGQSLRDRITEFGTARREKAFLYPTDGVVIKADQPDVREAMGVTSRAPRWAKAYKYEAERGVTIVRDIEVAVGRTGNISFTAVLDPVTVDGSTISRASLHNPEIIRKLDVRIGSTVFVHKANDIIPQVVSAINGDDTVPYEPPTEDADGFPYDTTDAIWRSTNPADSASALIKYAASRDALDIDGLGKEIADALVAEGVVADLGGLFHVQLQQLANLKLGVTKTGTPRVLGSKNAEKIVANIEKAKSQPLNRVITALGVRKSGRTFGRRLAAHFHTMDALLDATYEDFLGSGIEGIGPERARLFRAGFQQMRPVVESMRAAGVNMGEKPTSGDAAEKPLSGMTVVVTGAMDGPLAGRSRNEMNELIEASGGKASGSVSKNTSLLVCGEPGSSKYVKAEQLGVRIVTPTGFAQMVGV